MSYTPDVSMFPYFKKSSVKLLAENEELKEQIEQLESVYDDPVLSVDQLEVGRKLLAENKELKEKNKKLEEEEELTDTLCDKLQAEVKELKEKNKKLELAADAANARAEDLVGNWSGLAEDVVEVARLEDELNYLRERDDRADEIQKELDYQKLNFRKAMDENETVHKCWSDAQAENKGLKEKVDLQEHKLNNVRHYLDGLGEAMTEIDHPGVRLCLPGLVPGVAVVERFDKIMKQTEEDPDCLGPLALSEDA